MRFKAFLETYWGSKGAGVLAISNITGRLLVAMRSDAVNEPHTYGVVGGKVDDESLGLKAEASREFMEETGYSGSLELIPAYIFRDTNFEYHNFIGIIGNEFSPQKNWETDFFKWVTLEELLTLEPKHFGLRLLLKNSTGQIKKTINDIVSHSRFN